MESWLPVPEWNGIYEISDHGRVRRIAPRRGSKNPPRLKGDTQINVAPMRIVKPLVKDGYPNVCLTYGDRIAWRTVHALVAGAFLSRRPSAAHTVNHIDGDKLNNDVTNLEWATHREQQRHSHDTGLSHHEQFRRLTAEQAREVFETLGQVSNREWAVRLGVRPQTISGIRTGRSYRDVTGFGLHEGRYEWFPCDQNCECRCHQRRERIRR